MKTTIALASKTKGGGERAVEEAQGVQRVDAASERPNRP